VRSGGVRQGKARCGVVRSGEARCGKARYGVAWFVLGGARLITSGKVR